MPITPPSPEDVAAAVPLFDKLADICKWLAGAAAIAYAGFKVAVSAGVAKRQYSELREDVDRHEEMQKQFVTRREHDDMQAICQAHINNMVDSKVHAVVMDIKAQVNGINANLCHLMGQLDVKPLDSGQRRRRDDQ